MRQSSPQAAHVTIRAEILRQVALIGLERNGVGNLPDLTGRALAALAEAGADVLFLSQASASGSPCFVIGQERLFAVLDGLRSALNDAFTRQSIVRLWAKSDVILLRVHTFGAVGDICALLAHGGINILMMGGGADGHAWLIAETADPGRVARVLCAVPYAQVVGF